MMNWNNIHRCDYTKRQWRRLRARAKKAGINPRWLECKRQVFWLHNSTAYDTLNVEPKSL